MIIVYKMDLVRALDFVARASSSKSTMPVLRHVQLRSDSASLRLTCTDLDVAASYVTGCLRVQEPIACTVDVRDLLAAAKSAPGDNIVLSNGSGRLHFTSGGHKRTLPVMAADEFPAVKAMPEDGFRAVDAAAFRAALDAVRHAVSHDETRFVLNGICVEPDGTWVSTDGHRLAKSPGPQLADARVLVPRAALPALERVMDGDASLVAVVDGRMYAVTGPVNDRREVSARLIDGRFPEWQQVIPSGKPDADVTCSRTDLDAALARVGLASGDSGAVRMTLAEELRLSSQTPEGSAEDAVACDAPAPEQEQTVGARGAYLRDALAACGGEHVNIATHGDTAPIVISKDGVQCVVMPMRL